MGRQASIVVAMSLRTANEGSRSCPQAYQHRLTRIIGCHSDSTYSFQGQKACHIGGKRS